MAVLSEPITITAELDPQVTLNGSFSGVLSLHGSLTVPEATGAPPWRGEYTYTPTEDTQTVAANGYRLIDNITINPIPSNYGRIAWDGTKIRVF